MVTNVLVVGYINLPLEFYLSLQSSQKIVRRTSLPVLLPYSIGIFRQHASAMSFLLFFVLPFY